MTFPQGQPRPDGPFGGVSLREIRKAEEEVYRRLMAEAEAADRARKHEQAEYLRKLRKGGG